MEYQGMDFDMFTGFERERAGTKFPRASPKLCSSLVDLSVNELIQNIITLKERENISDLMKAVKTKQKIERGRDLLEVFKEKFTSRLQECFDYFQSQGLNMENQIQSQFFQALEVIFRKMVDSISSTFFVKIWNVLRMTNNFQIFHKVSSVLTSIVLYPSIKKFEKPAIKLTNGILQTIKGHLKQLKTSEQIPGDRIKILEDWNNLSQEEKLILHFHLVRLYQMLEKGQEETEWKQHLEEKLAGFIKDNQCQLLLRTLSKFPNLCKKIYEDLGDQLLKCSIDIEGKKLKIKKNLLSQKMISLQTIEIVVGKHNLPQKIISKQSIVQDQGKFYTYLNLQALQKIANNIDNKELIFRSNDFQIKNMVSNLLEVKNLQIFQLRDENWMKIQEKQFVCKLVQIFVKQLYLAKEETRNSELEIFYESTFVNSLFTTLFQWFQSEEQRKKPYAKLVLSDLISYSSFYIHRQKSVENQMTKFLISKSMEMMQLFGQILKDWRTIKHGRYLLQSLAKDTNAPIEKIKYLTDIMLNALFSQEFIFTRKSFYHFLQQKRPNEAYIQYFSQHVLKKVQQFHQRITKEQNFTKDQQKIQQANQFLFKVSTLLLGNFKLTTAYKIAEILSDVYLKFAQNLNQIYPLRSWIIHYKVPVQDIGVFELVKSIRDQIKQSELLSKKELTIQQYFKNALLDPDALKTISGLLQKISRVQNFLDLKQPSLNIECQVYQTVLEGILLPFSDWCTSAYIKSAQKIIQSQEMAKEIKNIVVSSLFKKQQSLYAKINSALIKMSLTFRIYVCNPGVSFNYGEVHSFSSLLGKLIIRLPQLDTNITKKLSLFRLFTIVNGLSFDELKSHLIVEQVIGHSLAYRGLAVNLRKDIPARLSLNIAIPMLDVTKDHLEKLIVLMTPDKRKQTPSISLFSHFLSGNKLLEVCEKVSKKDKRINDLIPNQTTELSRTILSNLFLPPIKTKLHNQETIGLAFYLRQIRIIFESENCEGFVQDHIEKILRIFKNKNSSKFSTHIRENNQVEPSNFSQYGIQPTEFKDFKIEVTKIVKTFLNKFALIFYNQKSDNLTKSLESTIKFVKQIASFSVNQQEKLSTEEMLIKLLQRGYEVFKKFIAEYGQNSQAKQNQQTDTNSNPEQGSIANQDDDDIQARRAQIYRLMRLKQQRKVKPSKSKLFSLFNVLAQVEKSKPNLVKKCFQIGMQVELLKFLSIANKGNAYEVTEICDFIGQTLPSFEAEGDQSQLNQTILYYKAILYSLEKLKLTNLDCINQLCIKLVREAKNLERKSTSDFWEELVSRISCIAFKCFELPNKMGRQELSNLVCNIMRVNTNFSKSITQFEVKNYIIKQFQKATFKQVKDVSKYSLKSTILPDWIELFIKQFKNRFSSRIEHQGREFYKVVRQLIKGWRKSNQTIVYTDGLSQLCQFKKTGQSFICYTVPQKTKALLTQIVQSFSKIRVEGSRLVIERIEKVSKTESEQQKENITKEFYQKVTPISKNIFNYLQVLENIFEKCQLVIPFVLQVPVKNMDGNVLSFLDFLIEICINEKIDSIIRFVTLLLCKNGLYANYVDQITYSQYVSARILMKIIESLKKHKGNLQMINQIIYFASVCLGVKVFNSMSSLPVSQDNKESLLSVIEELLNEKQQDYHVKNPIKLLYQQCHYLMNRHRHVEKIKTKNCLIQTNEDNQFIHKQLFEIGQEQDSRMKRFMDSDSGSDSEWEVKQQSSNKIILSKYVQKSIDHQKLNGYTWNNLDHCVISLEKCIKDENQFFNPYTPMFSIVSQEQNSTIYQIDGQKIAQFYKNFEAGTKQEGKQFVGRRRQQTRKFMIYTRPVTSISELRAFYKKLIHLLPASKYVISKKEAKYKNLEAEILDNESFETLRTELNYLRQGQAQRNMFIGTHFPGSRDQDLSQSRKIQQFICMLQSIKQNSEQFTEQESPKKKTEAPNIQDAPIPLVFKRSSSVTENNIMEVNQVVSAEIEPQQIVDFKQQNYRKLQAMNFSQRFQFLTNEADDHYFQNLPSQVSTEIREQAQLLKFQKQRIEAQKQRITRRRLMYGQDSYYYSTKRRNKKRAIPRLLHLPLLTEEQVDFKQETVQSILKCLFIKALINNSQSRSENVQLGCGKGINLLLETKRNDTKFRVLNFLIILIKKLEKLKVAYFFKDEEGQWKHQFKAEKKTIEQSQKKFVVEILDSIKSSLDKCLFNNDELVCKPLLKENFYKNVLSEQIDDQSLFQVALGSGGQFYNPLNELLNISLDYNHELMTSLMKRSKELPQFLIRKIFDFIGQNKIKCQSFYDNLQSLSSNPLLIDLFKTKYSKQNPTFQMLGKVLKYEFANIPCAKELHEKALKQYKKSYNQYLIQVLRLYSKQELMTSSELKKYKQIYCNIIENLYKSGENIKQSPIYSLVGVEQFLDYKSKLAIFRSDPIFQNLNFWTSDENVQQLYIDLNEVFASSYNQIMRLQPEQIRKKISVKFLKSTSRGTGMVRPLIQKIYVEMFKNSQMFIPVNLQDDMYQPSKYAVYSNQDYLNCYKFLGRILALCIFQDLNFPAVFIKTFYKMLLNIKPDWKDLKQVNQDVYRLIHGLKNMFRQNPTAKMSDIGVDLYYYYKGKDLLSRDIEYEFKQNGKNIVVTDCEQYVELATKSILIDFCDKEYEKIKEGFNQVLPLEKLSIFTPNDLQKLISGLPDVDKKQFKEVCKVKEFNNEDQEVSWFWKYVDECDRQQMSDLLQYFYGMSKLPSTGLKNINVQMWKIPGIDTFPRASLCFGIIIKLPKYTSYQKFTSNLHQAINQAKKGDGFMEG